MGINVVWFARFEAFFWEPKLVDEYYDGDDGGYADGDDCGGEWRK